MKTPPEVVSSEAYPSLCVSVGLSCDSCVTDSARHLARVCKGLQGPRLGHLFSQIYTDPACSPMAVHFAEQYRRTSVRSQALQEELLAEIIPLRKQETNQGQSPSYVTTDGSPSCVATDGDDVPATPVPFGAASTSASGLPLTVVSSREKARAAASVA